jgi:hypothetical protein
MQSAHKMFLDKYANLLCGISWIFSFFVVVYFAFLSWGASIDLNGATSFIFGLPVLCTLLLISYSTGKYSEKNVRAGRFSKYTAQFLCFSLLLFYLSGLFPGLHRITESPIKVINKISIALTGRTPDQWRNSSD